MRIRRPSTSRVLKGTSSHLRITVYTGEAESLEDLLEISNQSDRVVVESKNGEQRQLSFSAIATIDGPNSLDYEDGTPVFMDDGVEGAEPIAFEDGIERLREKLTDTSYESSLPQGYT